MTWTQTLGIAGFLAACVLAGWYSMPLQRRYARWRQDVWRQRVAAARSRLLRAIDDGLRAERNANWARVQSAKSGELQAEADLNRALAAEVRWKKRARGRVT